MKSTSTVDLPSLVERYDTLITRVRRVILGEEIGQNFLPDTMYQAVIDAASDIETDLAACLDQGFSPLSDRVLHQCRELVGLLAEHWSWGDETHRCIKQLARLMTDNYHDTPVALLGNQMFLDCAAEAVQMVSDLPKSQELPRHWTNEIVRHGAEGVRSRYTCSNLGRFHHFKPLFGALSDVRAGHAMELSFLLFAYRRFLRTGQEL